MTKIHKKLLPVLLAICLSVTMAPLSVWAEEAEPVCKIGEVGYANLDAALDAVPTGEEGPTTIELLKDIDYGKGMVIANKSVEFDLGEYDLNIVNAGGIGLQVTDGTVGYFGEGEFNVTGSTTGVYAPGSHSTATVTNAVGTSYGVNASYGKITVNGNIVAKAIGAAATNGGEIAIKGNVRAWDKDGIGAKANRIKSEITIDGMIDAASYIQIQMETDAGYVVETKISEDGVPDSHNPGYLKYSDTRVDADAGAGIVWIRDTVCSIGMQEYATLEDAIDDVPQWEAEDESTIIQLLKDIDCKQSIKLENKRISFDLNGFVLNINSEGDENPALEVISGAVSLSGEGELNVKGKNQGVYAFSKNLPPSIVTVTGAEATLPGGYAALADDKASITVLGDVVSNGGSDSDGAIASNGARIVIEGDVITAGTGVEADGARIEVKGDISASQLGVKASNGSVVIVDGKITEAFKYIEIDDMPKAVGDGNPGHGNPEHLGHLEYSNEEGADAETVVWVKSEGDTYALTISSGGAGADGAGDYIEGAVITIKAGTRSGYTFTGWTSSGGGIFENATSVTTAFTMPAAPVTVTANWKYNGGGSSGGKTTTPPEAAPETPPEPELPPETSDGAAFTDTANHWAQESIDYVVGKGLFGGTTESTFSPNEPMNRGMLVTVLGRLAGVDINNYQQSSFGDVPAGKYYASYIEWAYKGGIIQGIGGNQFAPDRAITREEIAVIFSNYAKATGHSLSAIHEAAGYRDDEQIGSAYKSAVTDMQQAGIMMGGSDNLFNPKAGATRAETATMLHRYIETITAPAAN